MGSSAREDEGGSMRYSLPGAVRSLTTFGGSSEFGRSAPARIVAEAEEFNSGSSQTTNGRSAAANRSQSAGWATRRQGTDIGG
jgi:hypothetical protein